MQLKFHAHVSFDSTLQLLSKRQNCLQKWLSAILRSLSWQIELSDSPWMKMDPCKWNSFNCQTMNTPSHTILCLTNVCCKIMTPKMRHWTKLWSIQMKRQLQRVIMSTYDINLHKPSRSMATNSGSQLTKNTHTHTHTHVSMATKRYNLQEGRHPIETLWKLSITPDSPESPRLSNRGQTIILRSIELPDTPPATNTYSLSNTNSVVQKLQSLALHADSEITNQVTKCIVCGKPYNQVIEKIAAE